MESFFRGRETFGDNNRSKSNSGITAQDWMKCVETFQFWFRVQPNGLRLINPSRL